MLHISAIAPGWTCGRSALIPSSDRLAGKLTPSAKPLLQSSTAQTRCTRILCSATSQEHGGNVTPSLLSCYQPIGWSTSRSVNPGGGRKGPESSTSDDVVPSLRTPGTASPARSRNGPNRPASAQAPPTVITRIPEHVTPSMLLNALLLVDKPPDWQASEVVTTIKWATKAPHVIHVGSLDAMASGLLVVAFGEAARLTPSFNVMSKRYKGTVQLGLGTETCDCTGKGTEVLPWKHVTGVKGDGERGFAARACMHAWMQMWDV